MMILMHLKKRLMMCLMKKFQKMSRTQNQKMCQMMCLSLYLKMSLYLMIENLTRGMNPMTSWILKMKMRHLKEVSPNLLCCYLSRQKMNRDRCPWISKALKWNQKLRCLNRSDSQPVPLGKEKLMLPRLKCLILKTEHRCSVISWKPDTAKPRSSKMG